MLTHSAAPPFPSRPTLLGPAGDPMLGKVHKVRLAWCCLGSFLWGPISALSADILCWLRFGRKVQRADEGIGPYGCAAETTAFPLNGLAYG